MSKAHEKPEAAEPEAARDGNGDGHARKGSGRLAGLRDWVDERTGYRTLMHEALDEPIPGGARWRYVFGSALTVAFLTQFATGVLLMTAYSPSSSTAWGSVYYISTQMEAGWLIRGLHHFGSQAMVILLGLHLIQVVLAGAYRAPREFNWWLGLALMFVTLGFSLTGYLLPWDQKGYWATKVATKIAGTMPGLGPAVEKVLVGGTQYGNQTLTRFYGLHVGLLPALLVILLAAHVALFRKHGVTAPANARGVEKFWPKQVFLDSLACLVVLAILFGLVLWEHGANLDAPADPSSLDYPARPEWYFLSLFQLLKKFDGRLEIIGTMVIPGAILLVLLILPLLDKVLHRKLAHIFACAFLFGLVGGAGYLTVEAVRADVLNEKFQHSREQADRDRNRALELAHPDRGGVPPDGAAYLLQRDPLTRGKALLEGKCLGCHAHKGQGKAEDDGGLKGADLTNYGSYKWVRGLLENPDAPAYRVTALPTERDAKAGRASSKQTGMQTWKKGTALDSSELDQVARFVAAFAKIEPGVTFEEWSARPEVKDNPAREIFVGECLACHTLGNWADAKERSEAPNLFAYGSHQWTARMIRRPGAPDLYGHLGKRQPMPAFDEALLTDSELNTLIRYIHDDYPGAERPGDGNRPQPASTR